MSKMIQVRNVPDQLHREIKRRAKQRGTTVTAYIQEVLERELERPPIEAVFERLRHRSPVRLGRPVAELIHEERRRQDLC